MEVASLVFITSEDGLLLVKQRYGERYWSLPGGLIERDETIDQAAVREVREETGLGIRLVRTVGVYRKPASDALAFTFEGIVTGGTMRSGDEILECRYFPLDELPTHVRGHFAGRVRDFLGRDGEVRFGQE